MAADNFDKALARVLVYEGGKVNHPKDPGGKTAYGVTQSVFNTYLVSIGQRARDVYTITKAEIRAIYKRLYWDRVHGDQLPVGLDLALFDAAVNSGVGQAAKWLQRALGADYTGRVDGDFGAKTLLAATNAKDNDALIVGCNARRMATLKTLRTWSTFGKGWSARIANLTKICTAWATGSIGPDPVNVTALLGFAKVDAEDVKKPIIGVTKAQVITGAGTAGSLSSEAASALDGFKDYAPWITGALVALTIAGIVLTLLANWTKDAGKEAQDGKSEEATLDLSSDDNMIGTAVNDNSPIPQEVPDAA